VAACSFEILLLDGMRATESARSVSPDSKTTISIDDDDDDDDDVLLPLQVGIPTTRVFVWPSSSSLNVPATTVSIPAAGRREKFDEDDDDDDER
jgi:hypothetical protein